MKAHVGGEPRKCDLCDNTFSHSVDLENHVKPDSREKLCGNESFQSFDSSITQKWLGNSSHETFRIRVDNHNDGDERVLRTAEIMQDLSSIQSMQSSQNERQRLVSQATLNVDISSFAMRAYGCGMCDEG